MGERRGCCGAEGLLSEVALGVEQTRFIRCMSTGRLAGTTVDCEQRQMVVQTPSCYERAARVEVFAVEASEADVDFSDELERGEGDSGRVKIEFAAESAFAGGSEVRGLL